MEVQTYLEKMKGLHQLILDVFEKEGPDEDTFKALAYFLRRKKIIEDKHDFKTALHLILKVANNHHRPPDFSEKIEKLFTPLKDDIKNSFSEWEIFNIFKSNKRIILYFFESSIITVNKVLFDIINTIKFRQNYYLRYFFPEFKTFLDQKYIEQNNFNEDDPDFDTKRKTGENEQEICRMIRNDSIDEFLDHLKKTNLPLSSKIEPSIFETNLFLIHKKLTLIEYAAFFGSFQIFKYLIENNVQISSSLWIYAIHGNNISLIHLLEEKKILPDDETYKACIKESFKCHHNAIAKVLVYNHTQKVEDVFSWAIQFYNFRSFPENFEEILKGVKIINSKECDIYYNMIEYDHYTLLDFFLKTNQPDINAPIISMIICLIEFKIKFSYKISKTKFFLI